MNNKTTFLQQFESKTIWHIIIIILLPAIVFFKVVSYNFLDFDDTQIIKEHFNIIGNLSKISEAFEKDAFLDNTGNSFYRPIQTVSFMFDAVISQSDPWMYHLSNLLIHIVTCISLYFFLRFLGIKNITSFLFTLLFSVHPLSAATISWVPARGDLLIGLFGILLFVTFGKYFSVQDNSKPPGKNKFYNNKYFYLTAHIFIFILAVLTKETSLIFPALLLFYYFSLLKDTKINGDLSLEKQISVKTFIVNFRQIYLDKRLYIFLFSWTITFLLYYFAREIVIKIYPPDRAFGLNIFIFNLPLIPILIGKFFIPINLTTMPLFDITSVVIGIIFSIILLYFIIKYSIGKKWIVLMGLIWFILFLIPSMLYRINHAIYILTYFEHRTYLPLIGLILTLAYIFNLYIDKIKFIPLIISSVLILCVFSYLVSLHCEDYRDSFAFFSSAINYNPTNALALRDRGIHYMEKNDTLNALADFNKALNYCQDPLLYFYRGMIKSNNNDHHFAENDFSEALQLNPGLGVAYFYRSKEKLAMNDIQGAFQDLNFAAKFDSLNNKVFLSLGDLFLSSGNFNEAIKNYTKAINLNSTSTESYNNRGIARLNLLDCYGAISDFKKVLAINPKHVQAYINMGLAYGQLNQFDNAIDCFTNAINISGNIPQAYYGRGMARQAKNDLAGARSDWNEALRLGFTPAKEMLDKYCK